MKKTIIITGANRGLGEAIAHFLINDENCFVISLSRSLSKHQQSYSKSNFQFIEVDLSKEINLKKIAFLSEVIKTETIYFINNASVLEPILKIENITNIDIDKTLSVNVKSTIILVQYLLKNYNAKKLTFANISSGAANRAIPNWSLYCSSKAFIQMFFNVAQSEYLHHRFLNINPGVMDTGMQKYIRESNFPDVENFKDLQKEGKLKTPKEVALEILKNLEINS
jgi:benzil reductase ((S)-benzoin forming)